MNGATSGRKNTKVIDIGVNKTFTVFGQRKFLTDLIRIKKCSLKGDSGGPVYLPSNKRIIGITSGKGGVGTLFVDGKQVAQGKIGRTMGFRISLDETFDIGSDAGEPVSEDKPMIIN